MQKKTVGPLALGNERTGGATVALLDRKRERSWGHDI